MTELSLRGQDWQDIVKRLGGRSFLAASARETKAFCRARGIASATDLLRLILAYCIGERGLRSTTAWASAMGLADISNVALLYRLRQSGVWLEKLVGKALAGTTPAASRGRMIRIIDATMVPQGGRTARMSNKVWRIHSALDLPSERFGFFELTDQHGGERLDRVPVIPGEIRIADRAYLQPDRIAFLLDAGADIVVRAGWRNACWLDGEGKPINLLAEFQATAARGFIDRPIWIRRKSGVPLGLRLIAVRKMEHVMAAARRKARKTACKGGYRLMPGTLVAAEWIILITSLKPEEFSMVQVLDLYRLRWRIELGFKRLKSLIGLKVPPGIDPRSAKPYLLAHLLLILLLEPLQSEFEVSPRWTVAP